MSDKKTKYHNYCKGNPDLPIFLNDWWLDIVCGKQNWDVAIYEKNNEIQAVMPFPLKKKYGLHLMLRPPLTPQLGPWITDVNGLTEQQKTSYEHKIYKKLIEDLPYFHYFEMGFNPQITNWLSFYWAGFNQNTHYTYIIPPGKEKIDTKTTKRIKKASDTYEIHNSETISDLFIVLDTVFKRQNINSSLDKKLLLRLDDALEKRNQRKILLARNSLGEICAGIYLVWDKTYIYQLLLGTDYTKKNALSNNLLVKKGLQLANENNLIYNFEGSMLQGVEQFIRHFGAIQQPYFYISKTNSRIVKLINAVR